MPPILITTKLATQLATEPLLARAKIPPHADMMNLQERLRIMQKAPHVK